MTNTTTKPDSSRSAAEMAVDLFDNWFDPIETEVRARRAGDRGLRRSPQPRPRTPPAPMKPKVAQQA
jgi:hypothetical protein